MDYDDWFKYYKGHIYEMYDILVNAGITNIKFGRFTRYVYNNSHISQK